MSKKRVKLYNAFYHKLLQNYYCNWKLSTDPRLQKKNLSNSTNTFENCKVMKIFSPVVLSTGTIIIIKRKQKDSIKK